jgi:hypothetical protein
MRHSTPSWDPRSKTIYLIFFIYFISFILSYLNYYGMSSRPARLRIASHMLRQEIFGVIFFSSYLLFLDMGKDKETQRKTRKLEP